MSAFEKVEVLDVWFQDLSVEKIVDIVKEHILGKKKILIGNHNLHSVYLFHKDSEFRKSFELAHFIHADGMPLIWWAKLRGFRVSRLNRITYLDLIEPLLLELNSLKVSVFFLGGEEKNALKAFQKMIPRYPEITFYHHTGFFDIAGPENAQVIEKINRLKPQVLFVGMGMPRQEKWIADHFNELSDCVVLPCGGLLDYLSGYKKSPPRWMAKLGFEWAYRLVYEPKRLFKRYLVEPIFLIPVFLRDLFRSTNSL